jgi:hypothetical protein
MLRLCIVQSIEYYLQHGFCTYVRIVLLFFFLYKIVLQDARTYPGLSFKQLGTRSWVLTTEV